MRRLALRSALLGAVLGVAACGQSATATFPIGTEVEIRADDLGLPPELMAMDGTVASAPCGPMGMCPSSAEVPVACEAGVCDPSALEVWAPVGDVIDIDAIASDVEAVFAEVDRVELLEVDYAIDRNTLTFPVEPIDVFWGTATATGLDDGARLLGTVPALAVGATGEGSVALDASGARALSDHLAGADRRFRVFVRTDVDFEPGQAWPAGSLQVAVRMRVRIHGRFL